MLVIPRAVIRIVSRKVVVVFVGLVINNMRVLVVYIVRV